MKLEIMKKATTHIMKTVMRNVGSCKGENVFIYYYLIFSIDKLTF